MGFDLPAAIGAAGGAAGPANHLHRWRREHDDEPSGAANHRRPEDRM